MPKVKVPRKSTSIDMTAMCDVAFLLLSFFILTTKFKPSEALAVETPKSVSTKTVESKDVVLLTIDREGKVYFSVSDENTQEKEMIINEVDQLKTLGLTNEEKAAFRRSSSFVGVPFSMLKSFLQLTPDQIKTFKSPGIPVGDTLNNEAEIWIRASQTAFAGSKMNLMVKGDNNAQYPAFKSVMDAFKKNEIFKFQLITDPENVPVNTPLWKKNMEMGSGKGEGE